MWRVSARYAVAGLSSALFYTGATASCDYVLPPSPTSDLTPSMSRNFGSLQIAKKKAEVSKNIIVLERQHSNEPLQRISFEAMVLDLKDSRRRLLLFGETHDDEVAQDVERLVYDNVARERGNLNLALEFLDADAREAVRAFNEQEADGEKQKQICDAMFKTTAEAKKYGGLALLAKHHTNRIIAANASSRHVKQVARQGVDSLTSLPEEDLEKLPPLPLPPPSSSYRQILKEAMGFSDNKIAAQNLWDVAMANSCVSTLRDNATDAVMLVCGRFHIQGYFGIVDHVMTTHKVDRDEFRTIVCLPMDAQSFESCNDPSYTFDKAPEALKRFADFVILTKGPPRKEEIQAASSSPARCPY